MSIKPDITYRGPSAFSEPETSAIRQFSIDHNFKTAINYHTYSNLIVYPFGYEEDAFPPEPDLTTFRDFSTEMFYSNHYSFGNCIQTIYYLSNGSGEDWMYGEQIEKPKIFSFCIEVGTTDDGFWPATDRIIPLADENLKPTIYMAQVAGSFYKVLDVTIDDDYFDPGETVNIEMKIQNVGLMASSGSVSMEMSTSSPYLSLNIPTLQLDTIEARDTVFTSQSAQITASASTPPGHIGIVECTFYENQEFICRQQYELRIGTPEVLLFDDAENGMTNWVAEDYWGLIEDSYEGTYSFTDSPDGLYENGMNSHLTTQQSFDLSDANSAYLQFYAKWDLENGFMNIPGDFAQVEVQADPDSAWHPMAGRYTVLGAGEGVQPLNEPGYAKSFLHWTEEVINLDEFVGNDEVKFRFEFNSDYMSYVYLGDGWYLDNISLNKFTGNTAADNETPAAIYSLNHNFPNPFNPTTTISFSTTEITEITELVVYNIKGQKVKTLVNEKLSSGQHSVVWNGKDNDGKTVSSGVYFYKMKSGDFERTNKMILMK